MAHKVVAVLGDSIAQGYVDETGIGWFGRLAEKISTRGMFGFHNMSMAGDNVADAYHRFVSECITRDIDILIITIGCNDTVRRGAPDAPMDLSPVLRGRYWKWLLDTARKNIDTVVVFDVMPVREDANNGEYDDENDHSYNRDIKEYNDFIAGICAERGIPFLRRYDKWAERDLEKYYVDFGHPNGAGHQLIADEVYAELEKLKII